MSTAADDALRMMDSVIRLKQENDQLRAEVERVSKAAAEMRDVLENTLNMNSLQFEKDLEGLINKHSIENGSNTPDFLLARFLVQCLDSWNASIAAREKWYGRTQLPQEPPASTPKTADPDGTSLPPGADDLQGHGTCDSKQANPIDAHDTGVYKSCGVFPATEDELRIVRTVTGILLSQPAASPATPPIGGMPGNGGALKP